ncbi:MAG: exopolysaccharide biosynthesis protein [Mesorhizobium sp.]|uniref:lipopolysaccharide biosynthesis protein n=1 Tax=Mesorhizobium sp. TaxID=1871066 RepID=UPI001212F174|nr:lipopolysaccharide biosynthesis protein [Mesorhizobium sp.]TIO47177.1 MAG: exopolysaccharide biosynthesis protein [Mesorhizobium sp.]TIO55713.1 MAG: exopolysaccharide biosynthesis protein [Mesorhizobium sp.]TJV55967.1 MAG: exopolysaccharide biosynthesis protein [Mesorhizobium sp.]
MIIELFGPAGSGKTTFANALAKHLRDHGYVAKVTLCYLPRDRGGGWDRFGIFAVISRISSAIFITVLALLSSFWRNSHIASANKLVRTIPPKSLIRRILIWQYIVRLSRCWTQAQGSTNIIIFDQGFVQAVGSLAMFNGSADDRLIVRALESTPRADLVVGMAVPRDVVEARLQIRMMHEPPAERFLEVDVAGNMRFFDVFEKIGNVLRSAQRSNVSVGAVDEQSIASGLCQVEQEIQTRLSRTGVSFINDTRGGGLAAARQADNKGSTEGCSESQSLELHAADGVTHTPSLEGTAGRSSVTAFHRRPHDVGRGLLHASIFALLVYIGGAGLSSMAQLGIARLVGATSYGTYSYALAWSTVLATLSTLGFNMSLLRFVPEYRAAGRWDLARGVITFALLWSLSAAMLAGLTGASLVAFSGENHQELQRAMLLAMAAVPLMTACMLGASLIRAFGGVVSALLPERVARDGLLLALVGGAAFSGWVTLDAPFAMMAVVTSSAVTVMLVLATAIKLRPTDLQNARASYSGRLWRSVIPPTVLITGLDAFVSRTGVMLLGWTGRVHEAGIFALCLNVAMLVGLSNVAVSTMFSPTAADLHARGDHEGLQRLFSRAAVLSFSGALALALALLVVTEPLLSWFGEDFAVGAPIARILIMGYLCNAVCGPQLNLLTMTKNEWAAATTMVGGSVAAVVACAAGIAMDGATGAAVGFTLALVVWNLAMATNIRKRLNILPGLVFAALALRAGQLRARLG